MSIISKLDQKKYSNLVEILTLYDNKIENWKNHLKIDGKNIEKANVEQASWLAYYDEIKVELRTLKDFFEMKMKETRGKCMRFIIQNSQQDHNERTRERMIDCDPDFIRIFELQLEVNELYNLVDSIVNQFSSRAFILNNLVKIRVAGIEDITLYE